MKKTMVYVVTDDSMEGGYVLGIFSTEHLAKSYARELSDKAEDAEKKFAKEYGLCYRPLNIGYMVAAYELDAIANK
ncbi:MAG: hypothetical protein HC888_00420 [Candidatus Competibacteraceae bacterium]|nr:hypothetical protein [Candidatus Competibacteraceae bacterium]